MALLVRTLRARRWIWAVNARAFEDGMAESGLLALNVLGRCKNSRVNASTRAGEIVN
jgi:hypothetical protein